MSPTRVVVIGGGISGLATAHRLAEVSRGRSQVLRITLVEAQERYGGLLETRALDGFLLEHGADAFVTDKPWALDLCQRLGLGDQLMPTNPAVRRSFIAHRGTLVRIPEGFYLVAPTRLRTLVGLPMLSWAGRLRMACDLAIPARTDEGDESVASFIRRRFGQEALERLAQPMVSAIYTADPGTLSLQATLPKFRDMEREHGSIIRALRAGARAQPTRQQHPTVQSAAGEASGPRYSLFVTLRGGMGTLVDALRRKMPDVDMRSGVPVVRLERGDTWKVTCGDGRLLEADVVCLALPAHQAAPLLQSCAQDLGEALAGIPYESVATVNVAYRRADVPHALDGFGFVVPAIEGRRIVGCTFSSVKFPGRAPEGTVLIRAFLGGALHRGLVDLDDVALERVVRDELRDVLGIHAPPVLVSIRRLRHALPQYHIGHLERVAAIEQHQARYPGLYLTGNGYRGMGIPDCIDQAQRTAERMTAFIEHTSPTVRPADAVVASSGASSTVGAPAVGAPASSASRARRSATEPGTPPLAGSATEVPEVVRPTAPSSTLGAP